MFSCSVVSKSLWPHGLQHTRLSYPSLSPGLCSNSCPLSWWCHTNILSSVTPFSSCPQSFPGSGSFPVSWLFVSGAKVLECWLRHQSFQWISSVQSLSHVWLFATPYSGLISSRIDRFDLLAVQGSLSLLQHHNSKASVIQCSDFFFFFHLFLLVGG